MKRFNELDEEFICEQCNKKIGKLIYTSRDHCPYCLYSKHVDIKYKDSYKIVYKCNKCGQIHKNIMARDDDMNKIIEVSKGEY